MRHTLAILSIGGLLLAGCGEMADEDTTAGDGATGAGPASPAVAPADPGAGSASPAPTAEVTAANPAGSAPQPVPIEGRVVRLTPENAKIEFVGTHVGDRPDPRTGGFEAFSGQAEVDPEGRVLKAVSVEIDTTSLWTQFPALTNHLNSPDFFDTREYPTARFESTRIEGGGEGPHTITGNLTLHGTTREIRFPATVTIGDDGLTAQASFTIDRTEFGMDRLQDRVENEVALNVVIGEKTQPLPSQGRPGGGNSEATVTGD